MSEHHKINYVELPCSDLESSQRFFAEVFGWQFEGYGPDYVAFSGAGVAGGFYYSSLSSRVESGGALIVLYSEALEQTQASVIAAGGGVCRPIFAFPGGRRFHFLEPGGNEMAVWSE